jgi:hypothetical protein
LEVLRRISNFKFEIREVVETAKRFAPQQTFLSLTLTLPPRSTKMTRNSESRFTKPAFVV